MLSHVCPWVPRFYGVRKICIWKAGTHCHTHQFSQSGQIRSRSWPITQCPIVLTCRHRENFWAFTWPRIDFCLIFLISNRIIHKSFTGPTHLLSANVRGLVSFAVSDQRECTKTMRSCSVRWEQIANFLDSFERIEWQYLLFKCGIETKSILNGFFDTDLHSVSWT